MRVFKAIMIDRTSPYLYMCGLIVCTVAVGLAACVENKVTVAEKRNIVFCTSETGPVDGKLLNKRDVMPRTEAGEIKVTGKLFFDNLKGWYTREPVPSVSLLKGDQNTEKLYDQHIRSHDAYWTGDGSTPCVIRTWIILAGMDGIDFDVEKLSLEYHSSPVFNHMLIGLDYRQNIKNFTLEYNQQPMGISGIDIVRMDGAGIQHGIKIRASFPPQPARSEGD